MTNMNEVGRKEACSHKEYNHEAVSQHPTVEFSSERPKRRYSLYQPFKKQGWIHNTYSSIRSRLKKSSTIKSLLSPISRKSSVKRNKSTLVQKFPRDETFPRDVYGELLKLISEGKCIIAKYVQYSTLQLNESSNPCIEQLEKSLIFSQQKLVEFEEALKCPSSNQVILKADLENAVRDLNTIINQHALTAFHRRHSSDTENITYSKLFRTKPVSFPKPFGSLNNGFDKQFENNEVKRSASYHCGCTSLRNRTKKGWKKTKEVSPLYDCVYEGIKPTNQPDQTDQTSVHVSIKSPTSFVVPSTVISLERFTTSMYVIPDKEGERIFVVFGSIQVNVIKIYGINGDDLGEFTLDFNWDQNNAYRVESIGKVDNSSIKQIVLNEVKGCLISDGMYALKQRLLFFDETSGLLTEAGKRLNDVINPLESVEIDKDGQIYVFDAITLMCVNKWAKRVDKISKVSVGNGYIACLSNDQVIICNKDGHQKYSWAVKSTTVRSLRSVSLQVYDEDVYVLAWATDAWPPNNILLKFDDEGRLSCEFYLPNKIMENEHGRYEFDCGPRQQDFAGWPFNQPLNYPLNRLWNGDPRSLMMQPIQNPNWSTYPTTLFDHSWFYATWFAITQNGNAIVTNITYDQPVNYANKKIIVVPLALCI